MKKNRKYAVLILIVGGMAGILLTITAKGKLPENNKIMRSAYGTGTQNVEMEVSGGGFTSQIDLTIEERQFTTQEIDAMIPEFLEDLEAEVLGNNVSLDKVCENLNFPDMLENYPFEIQYRTSHEDYVSRDGRLLKETDEPMLIEITAVAVYREIEYVHVFGIMLQPVTEMTVEQWKQRLEELIMDIQEQNSTEEFFFLPEDMDGTVLSWKEKKDTRGLMILALSFVASVVLWVSEYAERFEMERKRKEEILEAYPAFVLRYSMLVSAGLTLRQALHRIVTEGKQDRQGYLYQELQKGYREMETGISEGLVYENIGYRCNIPQMRKFGTLLSSNLRKGQEGLAGLLRAEAASAMADRREIIRKKGETAGTKLLFPMLLLLLIVFVIIMVPAFSSFTF